MRDYNLIAKRGGDSLREDGWPLMLISNTAIGTFASPREEECKVKLLKAGVKSHEL
jgi:hypothetical protein